MHRDLSPPEGAEQEHADNPTGEQRPGPVTPVRVRVLVTPTKPAGAVLDDPALVEDVPVDVVGRYGFTPEFVAYHNAKARRAMIAYAANRVMTKPCSDVGRRRITSRPKFAPTVHVVARGREQKSSPCRTGSASKSARRSDDDSGSSEPPSRAVCARRRRSRYGGMR